RLVRVQCRLGRAFLFGMELDAVNDLAKTIPESVYMTFQMTFAIITPALICGAFADRMKFSALLWFMGAWSLLVYAPIAHWVWGPGGFLSDAGVLDYAGGTVVHINAGVAGLVCALVLGKRRGYGTEMFAPHNLVLSVIGASLLWVGWFGFNAGSNLEANGTTALAFVNTMVATAGAALSWLLCEWAVKGKPSLLGICSGAVAGLVAVTPASGYAGPIGALVLGLIVSPVCLFFVSTVKNSFGYDDALDVFGVHCIGGIIGALGTGILVNPALGGVGISDFTNITGNNAGTYEFGTQMLAQGKAVLATLLWSGVGSAILYKVVDVIIGLRPTVEQEREGLDITDHGERAYNY
ncbi:MAG: ammonium transporter, Amt family, partial [Bradyrhizobium sp.]